MAATAPDSRRPRHSRDDSIRGSLGLMEETLDKAADHTFDTGYFTALGKELRRLHARIRIHHAADYLSHGHQAADPVPPELTDDVNRLRGEHPAVLGQLDRLIRSVDSMADRSLEDKEVFVLRGRELIAVLRRHEAEEDRLLYLSVWRETGGES